MSYGITAIGPNNKVTLGEGVKSLRVVRAGGPITLKMGQSNRIEFPPGGALIREMTTFLVADRPISAKFYWDVFDRTYYLESRLSGSDSIPDQVFYYEIWGIV